MKECVAFAVIGGEEKPEINGALGVYAKRGCSSSRRSGGKMRSDLGKGELSDSVLAEVERIALGWEVRQPLDLLPGVFLLLPEMRYGFCGGFVLA